MYYENVFHALNKRNVKYLVIGGLAINLHGIYRPTFDLDVMIALDEGNILRFVEAMEYIGYRPKAPVNAKDFALEKKREEWKREKGMVVFSFINPDKPYEILDVMIETHIDFDNAYNRRIEVIAKGIKIHVASINDLIELKNIAGREQDLIDIEELVKLKED